MNVPQGSNVSTALTTMKNNMAEYKVGDIKITARDDLGTNWLLCNGGTYDPTTYPDLYNKLNGSPDITKLVESTSTINGTVTPIDGGIYGGRRGTVQYISEINKFIYNNGDHVLYNNTNNLSTWNLCNYGYESEAKEITGISYINNIFYFTLCYYDSDSHYTVYIMSTTSIDATSHTLLGYVYNNKYSGNFCSRVYKKDTYYFVGNTVSGIWYTTNLSTYGWQQWSNIKPSSFNLIQMINNEFLFCGCNADTRVALVHWNASTYVFDIVTVSDVYTWPITFAYCNGYYLIYAIYTSNPYIYRLYYSTSYSAAGPWSYYDLSTILTNNSISTIEQIYYSSNNEYVFVGKTTATTTTCYTYKFTNLAQIYNGTFTILTGYTMLPTLFTDNVIIGAVTTSSTALKITSSLSSKLPTIENTSITTAKYYIKAQ